MKEWVPKGQMVNATYYMEILKILHQKDPNLCGKLVDASL